MAAYERAWSMPDEETISTELERCWTADSTHISPITDVITGVEALTRLILDLPVMFPDAHFRIITPTDFHHDVAWFAWRLESTAPIRMAGHDHGRSAEGLDFLTFDAQNRIRGVVAFFGRVGLRPYEQTSLAIQRTATTGLRRCSAKPPRAPMPSDGPEPSAALLVLPRAHGPLRLHPRTDQQPPHRRQPDNGGGIDC